MNSPLPHATADLFCPRRHRSSVAKLPLPSLVRLLRRQRSRDAATSAAAVVVGQTEEGDRGAKTAKILRHLTRRCSALLQMTPLPPSFRSGSWEQGAHVKSARFASPVTDLPGYGAMGASQQGAKVESKDLGTICPVIGPWDYSEIALLEMQVVKARRSLSSKAASNATRTSPCMAQQPLVKAQVPWVYTGLPRTKSLGKFRRKPRRCRGPDRDGRLASAVSERKPSDAWPSLEVRLPSGASPQTPWPRRRGQPPRETSTKPTVVKDCGSVALRVYKAS
nr:hypothetical protein Iba_chr04bCG14840 [Ipomoea batatas]